MRIVDALEEVQIEKEKGEIFVLAPAPEAIAGQEDVAAIAARAVAGAARQMAALRLRGESTSLRNRNRLCNIRSSTRGPLVLCK